VKDHFGGLLLFSEKRGEKIGTIYLQTSRVKENDEEKMKKRGEEEKRKGARERARSDKKNENYEQKRRTNNFVSFLDKKK